MKTILSLISLCLLTIYSYSQETYRQTIRGRVIEKNTQLPLVGVNVILLNNTPPRGTMTDDNGYFRLEDVAVGRQSLSFSSIGYKDAGVSNLLVTSSKEIVLNIELEQEIKKLDEVVIKPKQHKERPLNKMATVSARSFSIEETERYAGSIGDPSRMVSNFAGVTTLCDQMNDILIRGNSSVGILWRLDGFTIPNPNHFSETGSRGGPISILNNNVLSNSDFYTGAFPAGYGNAYSGVFDLNMRSGNNQQREYIAQVGFNGLELGAEGPLSKRGNASYLAAYRYSTLAMVDVLGIDVGSPGIPFYQDASLKITIPDTRVGTISLFGFGGLSTITIKESEQDTLEWENDKFGEDVLFGTNTGVIGLSQKLFAGTNTRIENGIALSGYRLYSEADTFPIYNMDPKPYYRNNSTEAKYSVFTKMYNTINSKNYIHSGVIIDHIKISYADSVFKGGRFKTHNAYTGDFDLVQAYTQWKHLFSNRFSSVIGVHYQRFLYNDRQTFEPRLGLQWSVAENHTVNAGFGMHSQLPPFVIYTFVTELSNGEEMLTNTQLDFLKSNHVVLGYDFLISSDLRLKTEIYYQQLYNIPVKESIPQYSMINYRSDFAMEMEFEDSLLSDGAGRNLGIELTLEHFFNGDYYYLITASLYDSKYEGYDRITRNSAFNGQYVFNCLAGKEFKVRNNNLFAVDIKFTWAGGNRYIPFSAKQISDEFYIKDWDFTKAYEEKYNDYIRLNIRLGYRMNRPKYYQEIALDLVNVTNRKNVFYREFDYSTGGQSYVYQFPILPILLWRVQF